MASPFIRPYLPTLLPKEILRQDSETQPYQHRLCFGGSLAALMQRPHVPTGMVRRHLR